MLQNQQLNLDGKYLNEKIIIVIIIMKKENITKLYI